MVDSSFAGRWPAAPGVPGGRRLRRQAGLVNEPILTRLDGSVNELEFVI
jgi:hypothetical protein